MGRAVPVSAEEFARWAGVPTSWVESLLDEADLSVARGSSGTPLVDPRALSDAIRGRADAGAPPSPADVALLFRVSRALTEGGEPEDLARSLLGHVVAALGARAGAILFHDEDEWLRVVAVEGVDAHELPEPLVGAAVWAAANHEPLALVDPRRAGAPTARQGVPHDALAVPFVVGDRVLGVIVALRHIADFPFGDHETELAVVLATELALALERVRMQHSLGRKLEEAHEQLEAYARDVRTAFQAEKRRTDELVAALDELEFTYRATVKGLAAAVEAKDAYTAGHLTRVSTYATMLLRRLFPEQEMTPELEFGFLLHDVGKVGVPDAVLLKKGPLDDEERAAVRRHTEIGRRIVEDIPFLSDAADVVLFHHEHWDGSGYPLGLAGEEIPLGARIFAVADAFDAMTSDRPYRKAMTVEDALDELRRGTGTQFWPAAVAAFLSIPRAQIDKAVFAPAP